MLASGDDFEPPTSPSLTVLLHAGQLLAEPVRVEELAARIVQAVVPLLAEVLAVDLHVGGRWQRTVAVVPSGGAAPQVRHEPSPLALPLPGLSGLLERPEGLWGPQAGAERRATARRDLADATLLRRLAEPLVSPDGAAVPTSGLLALPLRHDGSTLGLLTLWRRARPLAWPRPWRQAAQLLALQAASAVAQATLAARAEGSVGESQGRAGQLAFAGHAAEALGNARGLGDVLDVLMRLGLAQLADGCAVELSGEQGGRRTLVGHADPARRQQLAAAVRRAQPKDGTASTTLTVDWGCALHLPIRVRGVVRGHVTWLREPARSHFADDDVALAEGLLARAGEAIDRVWRATEIAQVSRVRDEFLRVASHELRTPLAALQLQLAGLRRHCMRAADDAVSAGAVQERAERALQQTARLSQLTDNLLDAARTFGVPDGLALRRRPLRLAALCRRVLTRMAPEASRRGCPLQLHVHAEVRGAYDGPQLARALHHLLANAIKYGERQPVDLHLSCHGPWAMLRVCDRGIGVASAARPRIFDRFERAVSGRAFGGLGLGLYLARRVVAAHGGTIRVRSNAGGGAAFAVLLPYEAADQATAGAGCEEI